MKKYDFYAAYTHAADVYGLDIDQDLFETYGFVAWNKIGNKNLKSYKQTLDLTYDGLFWSAPLPCNLYQILQVSLTYEDYQKTTPNTVYNNFVNGAIENVIESLKFNRNTSNFPGKLVKYDIQEDRLVVSENIPQVNLYYVGLYADEEGLPYLNFKEVEAIATYCAYSDMYKKSLMTQNGNTFQMAQHLYQKWGKDCSQARVPESMSVNDFNEILDAKSSWDRKLYNKSYKPIQN